MSKAVIAQLLNVFFDSQFNSGKELILNISRLLSKVSLDNACAETIVKSGKVRELLLAMVRHKDSSAILIRLAYILGNLTTNWEEVRLQLCKTKGKQSSFQILIDLAIYYFDKEENP